MTTRSADSLPANRPQRADARRNKSALLGAAATVFVASGVDAPIRDIATEAGVGTATIYRHFPTRSDLILELYRHQVEGLVAAAPRLLTDSASPHAALASWMDLFVDFLVTKQGLATVLQSEDHCYDPLHSYFLQQLPPVCAELLAAAARAGEIRAGQDPVEFMRGAGAICAAADNAAGYDARRLVALLVAGLRS